MSRRLVAALLIVLLAFAQHAALAHGISHAQHASQSAHSDRAPSSLPGCAFDTVYAEILATPGVGAVPAVTVCSAGRANPLDIPGSLVSASAINPRSTGPPALA